MKNETNHTARMGMLLALTAIAALCLPPQVRAGGGTFYPTVTNVTQLIADINYANTAGGTFTINLAPSTTFSLTQVNNGEIGDAYGLPVIGGTNAVNLTIMGNGDTIQNGLPSSASYGFGLFVVAPGASLTLNHVTLLNGWDVGYGGAIVNAGTLNVINGSILSGCAATYGGAIYNSGTVTISDSAVGKAGIYGNSATDGGGIYNSGGTVTLNNSIVYGNEANFGGGIYNLGGTVTVSNGSTLTNNIAYEDAYTDTGGYGGGIYNDPHGTVTVENSSSIIGNGLFTGDDSGYLDPEDVHNLGVLFLDGTSTTGVLDGNSARGLISPMLSIASWSSTAHQIVLSWSTNYTGCTLQSSTDPGSTNWTDCASPTVSGASFVVTNSMSAGAQFFRLKH